MQNSVSQWLVKEPFFFGRRVDTAAVGFEAAKIVARFSPLLLAILEAPSSAVSSKSSHFQERSEDGVVGKD